jgi:hypothetical protein
VTTIDPVTKDALVGARLVLAALVVALTYLSWLVLWGMEGSLQGLADLFGHHVTISFAQRFGDVWQFIFGGMAVSLIAALFASPKWSRRLAFAWLASLVTLAINGRVVFGPLDPSWLPILLILFAAGIFVWIHRIARRAA